jgi:hypothetical protein
LYIIRPAKYNQIQYLQTFSVGSLSKDKRRNSETPKNKISLYYPSDIVKLNIAKRKQQDFILILLFAIKSDGNIFIMEIEQNQLTNKYLYTKILD